MLPPGLLRQKDFHMLRKTLDALVLGLLIAAFVAGVAWTLWRTWSAALSPLSQ